MMIHSYRFCAFTAPCELQLIHQNKVVCDGVAAAVLKEAKRLEAKYSFFQNGSLTNAINGRTSSSVAIDDETQQLLHRIVELGGKTCFAFDIAFAGTLKECFKKNSIEEVQKCSEMLLPFADHGCFELKKNKIVFTNSHTKLDFGGAVKEYALDMAARVVKKQKIASALLDFGGDVAAIGMNGERKWRVAIKNPQNPSVDLFMVELENQALTTSGHYERGVQIGSRHFSHIIDRGGKSSRFLQATATAKSAMDAGIFSTALLVDDSIEPPKGVGLFLVDAQLNVQRRS